MGDKHIKIAFINNEGFPSGMATTNRILSLASGLVELKQEVTVFCVRPTENKSNIINTKIKGRYNGIIYIYTANTVFWPNVKVLKLYYLIKGCVFFFKHFNKVHKTDSFDVVISTTSNIFFNYCYSRFLKRKNIIYIIALDEYPLVVRNKSEYPMWFKKFYLKHFYMFFDGLIIMTKHLMKYYKDLVKDNTPLVQIPMTVEIERFENNTDVSPLSNDYIAYCGNLDQTQKDGVPILIEAFGIVKKQFKDLKLIIIGGANPRNQEKVMNNLKKLSKSNDVENDVIFIGTIHRDEMPKYLCNARLLALARPMSIQARGGFPTKLGDYLATGNPVIVTKVGEITDYLKDGVNSFLAEPDSADSFAQKIKIVMENEKSSIKIGKEGKKLAHSVFNYKVQAIELYNFLLSLIK